MFLFILIVTALQKMVIELLSGFKGLSPFKDATVDDSWDQINRCYVFLAMVLMGAVTTMRQYSGTLIACDGFSKFHPQFAEDYCWSLGMYTVREAYDLPASMVPYPGVLPSDLPACVPRLLKNGTLTKCGSEKDVLPADRIFHLWYQWASFYFWIVAILYYTPYIMFKQLGGSEYKPLIKLLCLASASSEKHMEEIQERVVNWLFFRFKTYIFDKGYYAWLRKNSFSLVIGVTKLSYLLITVAVFYLTGFMFEYGSNTWYRYGADWYGTRFSPYMDVNNSITLNKDILFPKMVACEIKRWGPSGIEVETAQCVLAPNVLYQYLFLFTWYLLVAVFFANLISCFLHISEMFFSNGTYNRMIDQGMLPNKPSYRFVFMNIGAGGREIVQILTDNSNPLLFSKIFNDLTSMLITTTKNDNIVENLNTKTETSVIEFESNDSL